MADSKINRPFYFMVPFWGQRYREYFVDLCLPSLLAPNNIPLLRVEDGHCFLIATTREDWQAIEHLPIMERLRKHVKPTHIDISDSQKISISSDSETFVQYTSAIQYMNFCLKMLVDEAYRHQPYGFVLCPDTIFSDGMIASMIKYAQAGYQLVLCPALRQTEEAVIDDLIKRGLIPEKERLSSTAQALTVPPRVMADLFIRHLHPEISIFEEGNPIQPSNSTFRFWRVPGSRGIILHTFYGSPVLMDFAVVAGGHSECLERGSFEDDYYSSNFANCDNIHIVQDSDEICIVSLTPAIVNFAQQMQNERNNSPQWKQKYNQLCDIRESMSSYAGHNHDAIRRDLFRLPIRWHTADLDEVWMKEEQRIDRLINQAVGDYYRISSPPFTHRFPSKFSLNPRNFLTINRTVASRANALITKLNSRTTLLLGTWLRFIDAVMNVILIIIRRVGLVLCGDKVALRWWWWWLRKLGSRLIRRTFLEPRPPSP